MEKTKEDGKNKISSENPETWTWNFQVIPITSTFSPRFNWSLGQELAATVAAPPSKWPIKPLFCKSPDHCSKNWLIIWIYGYSVENYSIIQFQLHIGHFGWTWKHQGPFWTNTKRTRTLLSNIHSEVMKRYILAAVEFHLWSRFNWFNL